MKLIIIYGPPASGKLTVAKELAKLTKFKLFHNHLSVDLVESVFEYGTDIFWDNVLKIRQEIFISAAQQGVNLIFTFVYEKKEDDEVVDNMVKTIESNGGEVIFVQLTTKQDELLNRVTQESRKKYNKINNKESLKELLNKKDVQSSIKNPNNLKVDNTNIPAQEVASKIVKYFQLNRYAV